MRVPYDTDDGFDSRTGGANNWHVAQMVEPVAVNDVVAGSIPAVPAIEDDERYGDDSSLTYHDWFAHFMLWLWWYAST